MGIRVVVHELTQHGWQRLQEVGKLVRWTLDRFWGMGPAITWILSPLQGQKLQLLWWDIVPILLCDKGGEVWGQ